MSPPSFAWLPVSALCTETHVYNTHHKIRRGSNTLGALEGNGMPAAGSRPVPLHSQAHASVPHAGYQRINTFTTVAGVKLLQDTCCMNLIHLRKMFKLLSSFLLNSHSTANR